MAETLTSPALASTATMVQNSPPIATILPIISAIAKFLYSLAFRGAHTAAHALSLAAYPLLVLATAPLPLLRYMLSPLIVFVQLFLGLFFVIPYQALVNFFIAIQPVYVFCGVACITGAVVGLGGRVVASFFNAVIEGPGDTQEGTAEQVGSLEEKQKSKMIE